MTNEKVGYIPESMIYVCRKPTVFSTHWNGETWCSRLGEERANTSLNVEETTPEIATLYQKDVFSTFPVSAEPKNLESRLQTARSWATGQYRWNPQKNSVSPPAAHQEITRENKPFTIQICGLDIREEGGRAYKVIDTEGHMFDLREDIAFEVLMQEGCLPGGHLNCQFLWGVVRNNIKLLREGSLLHQALERASSRREKTIIPVTSLIPGHVYQTKNLDKKIFVGWIPAPRTKHKYKMVWLDGRFSTSGTLVPLETRDNLLASLQPDQQTDEWNPYYLHASVTNEHAMVEEVADYSDLQDLLLQFAVTNLTQKLIQARKDLKSSYLWDYNDGELRKAATREIALTEKQIKELENIQPTLEVSK